MSASRRIVLAFASGTEDLYEWFIDRIEAACPALELWVVSEFRPPRGLWIPWLPWRTYEQNILKIRDAARDCHIVFTACLLQPRQPYWPMRRMAFALAPPHKVLVFNENLDHFRLHPRSVPTILKHFWWRARNFVKWHGNPGGWLYTQVWRLFHPHAYRRPALYRLALLAGYAAALRKRWQPALPDPPAGPALPHGISVVIPSRNGRDLLERLLPGVMRDLAAIPSQVIIVDNGSDDGTAAWLRQHYPGVECLHNSAPLAFSEAVNRGIAAARFSHTCLLNNDMLLEPGFFEPLLDAFSSLPNLFCATAQIFLPEGRRREETGKAVRIAEPGPDQFPVTCLIPSAQENLSPVYYGSGGCSLYDTRKLRQSGAFGECFKPAYVEDLDTGHRGWQRGWPTVYVGAARLLHLHRSTTRKYFSRTELLLALEVNYLRHLARSVASPSLFLEFWRANIERLNRLAAREPSPKHMRASLMAALRAPLWVERTPAGGMDEREALALGSGDVAVFPGRARSHRPLLLVASSYLPFPLSHGGAVRMFNLMRAAASDYDQVLICFAGEFATPAPEILDLCCEIVLIQRHGRHSRPLTARPDVVEEHDSPAFHAALRWLIARWQPALVQLEFTQMGLYAAACGALPTLLIEHDITLDLYSQLLGERHDWELEQQLTRWIRFERDVWQKVSCVVTMSEKDRAMVTARRVEVLPNGVDLERFQPTAQQPEPSRLLFIGSFAHLPNLTAIDYFLREVWPRLDSAAPVLHIIAGGRHRHYMDLYRDRVQVDLSRPRLEVDDFVSDVRPAYARAAIVIAPLLYSAGTNIKIFEAMAMGKAVVSTPAGINGLDLDRRRDVWVVESPEEMAQAILALIGDPARRDALGRQARRTVEAQFSWQSIAASQRRLYQSLITTPASSPAPGSSSP